MAFEHRPGQFSAFPNDKKGNDRAPDYKGSGKALDGTDIQVAIWTKKGSRGEFFSGSIEVKQARPEQPAPAAEPSVQPGSSVVGGGELKDDIPF